jgi:putative endonuclease
MDKYYFTYILASHHNGALYVGMTNNLARRMEEHKNGIADSFTKQYQIHYLVYYEVFDNPTDAIEREKQLKRWHRQWKMHLIERDNPDWKDLSGNL